MTKTLNGWTQLPSISPDQYFTTDQGKRVYSDHQYVRIIFDEVARRWHNEIEPILPATYNTYPNERRGAIRVHAARPPGSTVGTGGASNHTSHTGMDINGEKHPYERTLPPGVPYNDGFTAAQRNTLRKIRHEITDAAGRPVLRLGIDFPVGWRDGMHVEIAPGVTAQRVKEAALRILAKRATDLPPASIVKAQAALNALGYGPLDVDGKAGPATKAAVTTYQTDRGLTADGTPGPITRKALEDDMTTISEVAAAQAAHSRQLDALTAAVNAQNTITVTDANRKDKVLGTDRATITAASMLNFIARRLWQVWNRTAAIHQGQVKTARDISAIGKKVGVRTTGADQVAASTLDGDQ